MWAATAHISLGTGFFGTSVQGEEFEEQTRSLLRAPMGIL